MIQENFSKQSICILYNQVFQCKFVHISYHSINLGYIYTEIIVRLIILFAVHCFYGCFYLSNELIMTLWQLKFRNLNFDKNFGRFFVCCRFTSELHEISLRNFNYIILDSINKDDNVLGRVSKGHFTVNHTGI